MKGFILSIAISILLGINTNAQQMQLLDSAANSYTNKNYEKSISIYEDILKSGFESPELYYNLGNAYYKSNKIPYAILNYERAKRISKDEDVEFNLRLANTHIVDKIEELPKFFLSVWWNKLVHILSSNQWGIISIITFVTGLLFLLIFFLTRTISTRKFSFTLGVILLFVSITTFSFSHKQYWLSINEPEAIIVTPSIVVKSSPNEDGTKLFLIHEGLKVTITDKLGNWREIRLSDGNQGWVKSDDLAII
jgi:tetratricopeptide (TPR) repeat protein